MARQNISNGLNTYMDYWVKRWGLPPFSAATPLWTTLRKLGTNASLYLIITAQQYAQQPA